MTRRATRLLLMTLCVLVTGIAVAQTALAEPTGQILDLREDDAGNLRVIFSAEGAPEGAELDRNSLTARLDSEALGIKTELVEESVDVGPRTAVLAVDVSGSMRGVGLAGAKAAASAFLDEVPDDVLVGLVTFSDRATVRVRPTADRARVRDVIRSLKANGGTALFDGTVRAVGLAGTDGVRSVIVLSDGADDGSSRNTQRGAVARIAGAKVKVDAVSLGTAATQVSSLRALSKAGGGSVLTTQRATDLAALFAEVAKALQNQLVLTITPPDDLRGRSGNLTISGQVGGVTVSDTAFARTPAKQAKAAAPSEQTFGPQAVQPPPLARVLGGGALPVAIGAVFLALLFLLLVATNGVSAGERKSRRLGRRLDIYTLTGRAAAKKKEVPSSQVLGDGAVARSAMEFAGRVVAKRGLEEKLNRKLEAGGIPLKAAEWLLIHAASTLVSALFLFLLFGGNWVFAVLGLVVGAVVPFAYLIVKAGMRKKAFLAQLPDSLQLLSGSLSAGYSLPQAVDTIVREGQQPLAAEFNRVLIETRLGAPIEDALEGVSERMRSTDFAWVVMAIRIQREVGGNLAEVLTTVANTLRERESLRRHVRALSAEGRISAWILCSLPPAFVAYLALVRPEYMKPLITDFFGLILLGGSVVLMGVGIVWMNKVIKVEV